MKTIRSLIISVLMLGWMSSCSSIQNSELKNSPASSNLQTNAVTASSLNTSPPASRSHNLQTNAVTASSLNTSPPASRSQSEDVGAVIQNYYNAINRRDYEQAYRTWQDNGFASHQTLEAFKNGFADTASTQVQTGEPSQIEGAAGSQYVTIPVTLTATAQNQAVQHFKGTYVLRRSLVDGASADARSWHIYSAKLTQTE